MLPLAPDGSFVSERRFRPMRRHRSQRRWVRFVYEALNGRYGHIVLQPKWPWVPQEQAAAL